MKRITEEWRAMHDLNEMRRRAEEVLRDAERGHETLGMKLVLADLAVPLLQLIEAMENKRGQRWLFLEEVMKRTGWSRNWFDKPLKTRDGRSRLQVWEAEGMAEQADNGFWLISPARVPPRKPGYQPPDEPSGGMQGADTDVPPRDGGPATETVESIVDKFSKG